jgi:hypothetical protein
VGAAGAGQAASGGPCFPARDYIRVFCQAGVSRGMSVDSSIPYQV